MPIRSTICRTLVAATLLLTACGNTSPNADFPSGQTWSSAHFEYHTRTTEADACPDVPNVLEEHFMTLQAYLGFAWPAGSKVTYYKFTDAADFAAHGHCPADAGGCAPGTSVESTQALDTHELVHAYLAPTGAPPWVLVEGVAVALSCTGHNYKNQKPTLSWDQLASVQSGAVDPVTAYSAGAWLVGYLLAVHGGGPFLEVYESLPRSPSSSEMDAAFTRVYGQSLADIWAAALAEDQPRNTCAWQCSRPPLALDGTAVDSTGTCGVDMARPFALAAPATISISTTAADISLGPCGPAAVPGAGLNGGLAGGLLALYHLEAGSYFLSHSSTTGMIVGNADASLALNPACDQANDIAALSPFSSIYVAVPPTSSEWYLPVPPPPNVNGKLVVIPNAGTSSALVCSSCGGTLCSDPTVQAVAWTTGQTLLMHTDPTQTFSEFSLSWP